MSENDGKIAIMGSMPEPEAVLVDSLDINVVSETELATARFWKKAQKLFESLRVKGSVDTRKGRSPTWERYGRKKLEDKMASENWAHENDDPLVWQWSLTCAVEQVNRFDKDPELDDVICVWAYGCSLIWKYIDHGVRCAERERRGRDPCFRTLKELEEEMRMVI